MAIITMDITTAFTHGSYLTIIISHDMKLFALNNLRLIRWLRKRPFRRAFLTGFIFGLIVSGIYIVTGGSTWLFVPIWAEIVFCSGIFAGIWFYENISTSMPLAHLCGWLTVGISYGFIFLVLYTLKKVLFR